MIRIFVLLGIFFLSTSVVYAKDFTHLLKDGKCAYPTLDEKLQLGCPWIYSKKSCDNNLDVSVKVKQKTQNKDNLLAAQWKIVQKEGFNKIEFSGLSKFIVKKYNNEDYAFWYSGKVDCRSTIDGLCNMMEPAFRKSVEQYTGKPYYTDLWGYTHKIEKDQAEIFALKAPEVMKQLTESAFMLAIAKSSFFEYNGLQEKWAAMFLGTYEYGIFGIKNDCCESVTMVDNDKFSKTEYKGYKCGSESSRDPFNKASCKQGDLYFVGNTFAMLEWGQNLEPEFICVPSNFKCPSGRYLMKYTYVNQLFYGCVAPPENARYDTQLGKITCNDNFSNYEYRNCETEYCEEKSEHLMLRCIPICNEREYSESEECKPFPFNAHKVNEYNWECNQGFSRYNKKDECWPWPKGSEPSKGCWFSSIKPADLAAKADSCPEVIKVGEEEFVCDEGNLYGEYGDDCSLSDCLDRLRNFVRGPLGTNVVLIYPDKQMSVKMKQNFTQDSVLGKWSGCWKCPKGSVFDMDKNECITKEPEFPEKEKKSKTQNLNYQRMMIKKRK